ncbi:MAG: site-specific integrase [Acidiferrobacterales bacterium]
MPLARTAKPRLPGGRERRLEDGEENRLLDAASPGLRLVIRFASATAMRRGEIASLRWKYVDLKQRSAHLPTTKNRTARTVPLSREAIAVLESIPRRLDGTVFGMTENTITHAMFLACRAASVKGLTFHDLRHEAISRLFENTDLDAMEIARISGHKTLSMLSQYTHLRAHRLADRLDGAPRIG